MVTAENGLQGDTTPTSNAGLPISYGSLIPDPGQDWGYQWGWERGRAVALSYSFPGAAAAWASDYSDINERATYYSALDPAEMAAVESALAAWSSVANITFTEVTTETATDVGQFRFAWTEAANGGAWAWAYFPGTYSASGGDVWLSAQNMGATRGDAGEWLPGGNAHEILLHEIGHALGLKHPFEGVLTLPAAEDSQKYTVMSYGDHPSSLFLNVTTLESEPFAEFQYTTIRPDTLMLYDILAAQYLYGANMSYNAGNDVYGFDPATPFIRTLWDGGGTDTISVGGFSLACTINLTPGTFSKIAIPSDPIPMGWIVDPLPTYDGTDNLAIAFNCWIENAIGGSGADTIIGNNIDNALTGGLGNDTLTGGLGADSLDGGSGTDIATYAGPRSAYTVTKVGAGYTVTDSVSDRDGSDGLAGIERLLFFDQTLVLGVQRDFGGDGKSDILLRSGNSGEVAIWQINGAAISGGGTPGFLGAGWAIVESAGDYDGDGNSDILLHHATSGEVAIWQIHGSAIVGGGALGFIGAGWSIADGSGDYNGDGNSDILLHHSSGEVAIWMINGTAIAGGGTPGFIGAGWSIADGSGDYDGDGKSDILLRNTDTGQVAQWLLNGSTISGGGTPGYLGADWSLADGASDYNGDGRSDVLLSNTITGEVAEWQLNGSTISGGGTPGYLALGWTIAEASCDYNGDGMGDILLYNTTTGQVAAWLLNGGTISGGGTLGYLGAEWVID